MRKKRIVWIGALLVLLLLATGVLTLRQPVIPSRAYAVTAMLNGQPVRAELMTPLFHSEPYFIHVPDAPNRMDKWFGIAFARQSVFLPFIYEGLGLPYVHTDQLHGLSLTSGKMETPWKVAFTADGVEFSSETLSVVLRRK
ncbi:hypothetical protein WJU23_06965 [Prosthecobacter sp. SYSU 5D2]|uniref:hypothetical protein n=1 Tax=Prosthecobacter sp. SYSU 5D2 TaxID=3134134 RepID=UPI0031FF3ABE